MKIKDITAIVTGGGSGLGEATARALAEKGAKVAILDLRPEPARQVAGEIGGIAVQCDVADPDAASAAVDEVCAGLGAPRILVNCAGLAIAMKTLGKEGPHPLEQFERVVRTNLVGTFNMIRLVTHRMQALDPLEGGERGIVINTASVAAYDGQIGQAAYSASKGGVVGMTLPIARDLAWLGIRVMSIAPGPFRTPMLAGLPAEAQAALGKQMPFPPRLGEPSEYAALVVHIVENQMLNGETIRIDGAARLPPR